jgi:hypothetical protein
LTSVTEEGCSRVVTLSYGYTFSALQGESQRRPADYPAEFPSVMCGYEKESREAEASLAIARKKKGRQQGRP